MRTRILTVGDLKAALAEIPDDTPIGRVSDGSLQVIKTGATLYHGPIGGRRGEKAESLDELPNGSVVVQFES